MYSVLKTVHSYWAYLALAILIIAAVNALMGMSAKRTFGAKDLRLSLWINFFSYPAISRFDFIFCFTLVCAVECTGHGWCDERRSSTFVSCGTSFHEYHCHYLNYNGMVNA